MVYATLQDGGGGGGGGHTIPICVFAVLRTDEEQMNRRECSRRTAGPSVELPPGDRNETTGIILRRGITRLVLPAPK